MDRRGFLRALVGVAAATAAASAVGMNAAEAAPMPVATPPVPDEAARVQGDYRPDVDGAPATEQAQYYYYRRRRWRPRRRVVYYRPRYRRRFYYRPRRVYYRRPMYRRRYYW